MTDRFLFWMLYPIAVFAVIWVGWNQPLRYRFMSAQEIAAAERGEVLGEAPPTFAPSAATPTPKPWMFEKNRGNALEQRPPR